MRETSENFTQKTNWLNELTRVTAHLAQTVEWEQSNLNKVFGSKFREFYRIQQIPEQGRRVKRPKHCDYKSQYTNMKIPIRIKECIIKL